MGFLKMLHTELMYTLHPVSIISGCGVLGFLHHRPVGPGMETIIYKEQTHLSSRGRRIVVSIFS